MDVGGGGVSVVSVAEDSMEWKGLVVDEGVDERMQCAGHFVTIV